MKTCEIFHLQRKTSFTWKWRYVGADGATHESGQEYALFYECVSAARASGYEPRGLIPAAA